MLISLKKIHFSLTKTNKEDSLDYTWRLGYKKRY